MTMNEQLELELVVLKAKDVPVIRAKLLAEQDNKCLICREEITGDKGKKAALDHDHASGFVRGVLCSTCNTGEGALIRAVQHRYAPRNSLCWTNPILFIERIIEYWSLQQTNYIHPTWDIEKGKQKTVKRKRKTRTTKPKTTRKKK